jgi:hypothetical protein
VQVMRSLTEDSSAGPTWRSLVGSCLGAASHNPDICGCTLLTWLSVHAQLKTRSGSSVLDELYFIFFSVSR